MSQIPIPSLVEAVSPPAEERHRWSRFATWVAATRAQRVICVVVGIWILNAFDLVFTLLSNEHGMLHEQNPVARQVLAQGHLSVMLFKIGLVLIGSYPLLRFRRARIAELGAFVVFVAYALLAVRWSVCFELYALTLNTDGNLAELQRASTTIPY